VMVLGCGPWQVVLPDLHEMALVAHGWFPSAECAGWGRTAPALTSRRPGGSARAVTTRFSEGG